MFSLNRSAPEDALSFSTMQTDLIYPLNNVCLLMCSLMCKLLLAGKNEDVLYINIS